MRYKIEKTVININVKQKGVKMEKEFLKGLKSRFSGIPNTRPEERSVINYQRVV